MILYLIVCLFFRGTEPSAQEVLQLIHRTGGISALAHPWALKNPIAVIRSLKAAGLHAMEVYRSDGKASGTLLNLALLFLVCFLDGLSLYFVDVR